MPAAGTLPALPAFEEMLPGGLKRPPQPEWLIHIVFGCPRGHEDRCLPRSSAAVSEMAAWTRWLFKNIGRRLDARSRNPSKSARVVRIGEDPRRHVGRTCAMVALKPPHSSACTTRAQSIFPPTERWKIARTGVNL